MKSFVSNIKSVVLFAAMLLAFSVKSAPLVDDMFDSANKFDPAIKQPDAFLGHRLGDQMTRNDRMIAYFKYLASQSERIKYEVIAYSNEQRPIVTLTITSIENQKNLAQLQA
ncbi:MAG: hypothetical protein ACTH7Q_14630 [Pseudoalteromonas sp.]